MRRQQLTILMAAVLTAGLLPASAAPPKAVPFHGKGKYATSRYGRIYYETEGRGPAVFLVAGGPGGSHASFHPWFSRLAKDHTVVYFDNIGRGRSSRLKNPNGYTVPRDAEDIEAIRKALGLPTISLIGHSYGGFPAMAYALKYPQRTARLVLSDTLYNAASFQSNIDSANFNLRNQYPEVWAGLMAMRARGIRSNDERYGELLYRGALDLYWYDPANEAKMFFGNSPADGFNPDVYNAMLGADPEWRVGGTMRGYDPTRRMRGLRVPTLICVGRYDRIATPRVALQIKNRLPNARLVVFERSGHRPWVEESDRYFQTIGQFLAR